MVIVHTPNHHLKEQLPPHHHPHLPKEQSMRDVLGDHETSDEMVDGSCLATMRPQHQGRQVPRTGCGGVW